MLFALPRRRRRALVPLALPAVANVPAAQAGALSVMAADSAIRREQNVAAADLDNVVSQTIVTSVANGAELDADKLQLIPVAHRLVLANPQLVVRAEQQEIGTLLTRVEELAKQVEALVTAGAPGTPAPTGGALTAKAAAKTTPAKKIPAAKAPAKKAPAKRPG
jgi:hypothetical protein